MVWLPGHTPHLISAVCPAFLLNSVSLFLGEGLYFVYMYAAGCLRASNCSGIMGGRSCVCGAKTGETSMRGCVTTRKHQAIVTREWVTCSGSPVCSCARVCVCVSYCGILNGCMRMHACVCVCVRWSVPAAGVGLQHWGLVSPGAKNYGQWDPASELSCWRDPPCRYVEIYILISGPPS